MDGGEFVLMRCTTLRNALDARHLCAHLRRHLTDTGRALDREFWRRAELRRWHTRVGRHYAVKRCQGSFASTEV